MKIGLSAVAVALTMLMSMGNAAQMTPVTPATSATIKPSAAADTQAANATAPAPTTSTVHLPFSLLGAYEPIRLRGIIDDHALGVGVRLDRVITAAHLHLVYTYSPSLVFPLSHIRVLINNQAAATVPFDAEHAGKPTAIDIPLDPRFFADFNQVSLELVSHYTVTNCEDPSNSALWTDISPASEIVLEQQSVELPSDLALLPAPFFDRRDSIKLVLPFVLPANPSNDMLRSAAVIASWFGVQADYRGAKFPVLHDFPEADNAIVMATAATLPAGLNIAAITGPELMIVPNPRAPDKKLLLVLGRDAAQLQTAVNVLVMNKNMLTGASVTVGDVDIGAPRKPYDAPKWLPVDRAVQFKNVVANSDLLQVHGSTPDPIRIDMHLPADLFAWNGRGVPLDLHYRYTSPSVVNDSSLNVAINGLLIKSFHLSLAGAEEDKAKLGQLRLPILNDDTSGMSNAINIPAFRVGSDNQLQLKFTMDSQKSGLCSGVSSNPARAAIDPDSTIDFSGFAHYAVMPNLAFFANSGFPFTTYADLAQTLVVVPDKASSADLESMLSLMGEMGKWTGFPALRVQVAHASSVQGVIDKDILVIGSGATAALMRGWSSIAPMQIAASADNRYRFTVKVSARDDTKNALIRSSALFSESGPFGTLVGFESPYMKYRSVVALAASDDASLGNVVEALQNPGQVSQMQGDLTVIRGENVQGQRIGPEYVVGDFPWYARIWMIAIQYPLALAMFGVLAGILVAIGVFLGLQALAARRRGI
ncbi:MAG TPA: cellulose biosynthesis cyclic di-GMP-binding regulatory protein BcsB [Herbaspirillum sp.]|nr:cellulose biosynthesis cyclic di-GMP-binding regulatory protein BcsB [Herbaspirillum sp.]